MSALRSSIRNPRPCNHPQTLDNDFKMPSCLELVERIGVVRSHVWCHHDRAVARRAARAVVCENTQVSPFFWVGVVVETFREGRWIMTAANAFTMPSPHALRSLYSAGHAGKAAWFKAEIEMRSVKKGLDWHGAALSRDPPVLHFYVLNLPSTTLKGWGGGRVAASVTVAFY